MSHLNFSASASLCVTGKKNVYVPRVVNGIKSLKWWQVLSENLSLVPGTRVKDVREIGGSRDPTGGLRPSFSFPKNSHEDSTKAVYSVPQFPISQMGTSGNTVSSLCPFFLQVSKACHPFFGEVDQDYHLG